MKKTCKGCHGPLQRNKTGRPSDYCCSGCKKAHNALTRVAKHLPAMLARATQGRVLELRGMLFQVQNGRAWNKGVESAGDKPRDARGRFVKSRRTRTRTGKRPSVGEPG